MPSSIRKSLDELPVTLDDTYERILQNIPKQKWQHAHRLFQCVVAARRPLRVEELAEIFAIGFGPNSASNLVEDWRPENAEEAVFSCTYLYSTTSTRRVRLQTSENPKQHLFFFDRSTQAADTNLPNRQSVKKA